MLWGESAEHKIQPILVTGAIPSGTRLQAATGNGEMM